MTTTTFVDEVTVIEASWLNDVNADVYGVRPVATGGTGATDAADARTNLGLGNVDNTSDASKPVSTAQQAALNLKANILSPSFTTPSLGVATATSLQGIIGNVTPAAGTFTTLTSTGNAALGDAEATDTHAIKGATTLLANSASAALTVTQTGAGNAFVVEDSASTDSTPFVIDANGTAIFGHSSQVAGAVYNPTRQMIGLDSGAGLGMFEYSANVERPMLQLNKSRGATANSHAVVANNDPFGQIQFAGSDGTAFIRGALIEAAVDGTPGTNDMPGRLVFSTTADGASSPTERMRIDNAGNVGIGGAATNQQKLRLAGTYPGSAGYSFPVIADGIIDPAVAATACYVFQTNVTISAGALPDLRHFTVNPGAYTGTVTTQYGFIVPSTLTGATNNYGFYGNIAAAANRYNFYAAGTADNYFAGSVGVGGVPATGYKLLNYGNYTGSTTFYATATQGTVQSDVTVFAVGYRSALNTAAAAFTLSSLFHYIAEQGTVGAGSTVTSQHGFNASAGLIGASNNYGFSAGNTAAVLTGKVAIGFYSAVNTATGGGTTWGFYGNGTANNAYAGNSSFGKVTAPTSAVDTTSFGTNLVTNTSATYTVLATDGTIIQTTTASTYTLPAASSFPGRILKLLTQFAGAVVSASSNVVPIAGGAAGTAILAATAGKYAVLQSTGTNWQITEAN